ncbi:hypothetical protein C8F01DRAFT_1034640 [Mycena amicta]|nr:hypothetical protein C8F01DRAFT_1034640 [Mycena amicta]
MGRAMTMEGDGNGNGNGKRPCLSLLTTTPLASTTSSSATSNSPLSATATTSTRSPRSPSPPAAILPPGLYVSSQLRVREPVSLPEPEPVPVPVHVPRVPVPSNALPTNSRYSTRLFVAPGPTATTPTNAPQPHPTTSPTPTPHRHPHAPVKSVAPSRWHSILPPLDTGFDFRGQLTSASAREGSPTEIVEDEQEQEQELGGDVMVEVRDETPTTELVQPASEYGAVTYEQGCWSQSQTGASGYQMTQTQTQWYHGHSTYVAYPGQQHQPEPVYHSPVSACSPTTVSADQHEQPTYNTHYPSQAFRYPRAYSPVPAPAPVDSHSQPQPQPQPQPHFITEKPTPLSPREASGVARSLPHAHAQHHHPYGYARGLPMRKGWARTSTSTSSPRWSQCQCRCTRLRLSVLMGTRSRSRKTSTSTLIPSRSLSLLLLLLLLRNTTTLQLRTTNMRIMPMPSNKSRLTPRRRVRVGAA